MTYSPSSGSSCDRLVSFCLLYQTIWCYYVYVISACAITNRRLHDYVFDFVIFSPCIFQNGYINRKEEEAKKVDMRDNARRE